uniref:Rubicon Homology domain-containing protein n=1 Tax=Trichobilharzia regenti TaxID=157069 RepID=A0AA85JM23_TRIRE|nr:unnamed protein product [Trichobilharzia regenti]
MSRIESSSTTSMNRSAHGDVQYKSRYYLHHHGPDHYHGRPLSSFKQHMSSSTLAHLIPNASQKHLHRQHKSAHRFEFSSAGNLAVNHSSLEKELGRKSGGDETVFEVILKGHVFVRATCSRLRECCEFCQHSVHGHSYLYCRNCPVVIHNKDVCQERLTRVCPVQEIGITGWGEGNYSIKFEEKPSIDLEAVFLSGLPGLQSNKCFECGRILDARSGHELVPDKTLGDLNESSSNNPKSTKKQKVISHLRRVRSHHQFSETTSVPEATAMRICHMTGKYYCERCHWNDVWYIPGSIFLLNDKSKQPVSRSIYIKMRVMWDSVVLRVPSYWHRENLEAAQVYEVRSKLHNLLRYTLLCPEASSLKATSELVEPAHLLGYPDYYRMCDVLDVLNGTLYPRLLSYLKAWSEHVSHCSVCGDAQKTAGSDGGIWVGEKLP